MVRRIVAKKINGPKILPTVVHCLIASIPGTGGGASSNSREKNRLAASTPFKQLKTSRPACRAPRRKIGAGLFIVRVGSEIVVPDYLYDPDSWELVGDDPDDGSSAQWQTLRQDSGAKGLVSALS